MPSKTEPSEQARAAARKQKLHQPRELWAVERLDANGEWQFWDVRRRKDSAEVFLDWNRDGREEYRVRRYAPDEAWAEERREVAAETARWEETAAHLLEQKEAADKENTRLRAALTEIEQGDGNCLCPHDTDECCATQGSETFCAHCIAGRALAERMGRE